MMALAFGALHLAARQRHRLEDLLALIGGLHIGLARPRRPRLILSLIAFAHKTPRASSRALCSQFNAACDAWVAPLLPVNGVK